MSLNPEIPLPSRISEIPEGYVQIDVFAPPEYARIFASKIEELTGGMVRVDAMIGTSTYTPLEGSDPADGRIGETSTIDEALLSFPWPAHAVDTLTVILATDHRNDTFVIEVSDPRDAREPSSFRVRVASSKDAANSIMDGLAKVGVGRIENYDRCFFIYDVGNGVVSLETIINPAQVEVVSEVLAAHSTSFVLDPLARSIELKGKRGVIENQEHADTLFRAYKDTRVIFE